MPEEGLETHELREKLDEANEHAHAAHGGGEHHKKSVGWLVQLSLSTALIAVFAAIAALESGSFANDALVEKNEAVLKQSQASDQWAFFQAKGIKSSIYAAQADALAISNAEEAHKLQERAKKDTEEQKEIEKKAHELEAEVAEKNKESEHSLHVHHEFAKSVTIFQIAIALSAIAALTRKKPLWFVSLAAGIGGILFFLRGFGG